ncbi:zincin-like metallopeptidase domain-containing protein [Sphingomonas donggukensis]|uniref:Zincin-like metallopeptidase domain-containing protein n=1 Tax=Sphingomonas donggukensis TaxID=2949093 RepID=A0ABY4TW06_9SPHN|nr:zincin-like metallopeptidase domain-containing protein [Sphingomonas donggukensis]URW75901.1 zincin-like metallopeptidase domain-containing protein [Sphingomonas donggukensis]
MPITSKTRRPKPERPCIYDEITQAIIADLEAGRFPWAQPWGSSGVAARLGLPRNAASARAYSGINILILWGAAVARGFSCQSWLTFRQALALGGNVRKGERGTTVVYADRFEPKHDAVSTPNGEPQTIHFLKRFTVFSTDQCEGLPERPATVPSPLPEGLIAPTVQALISASGADLRMGGDQAFYSPTIDFVQVPRPEAFFHPIDWHRTALHELGHWTGHRSRLNRDQQGRFGTSGYAREELVAELCAAFCCATLGIRPTVRHADYLGGWLDVLREDSRAIVRAASAASKAADILLGFVPDAMAFVAPAGLPARARYASALGEEEEGEIFVTG